ncbi:MULTISPECIES: hypothetical protein [unclassified Lentimonas]|uniref:hypothetical protein n=1 Tax=unclassified Lentimonas TaxID=2630993 RepID=UPI0013251BC8|nr:MULTISPECIES: hypothetical protein [unclassified Lentimonas]CAA6692383.1 Unannotated [Lentimonas sp. CC19]CAA6693949.1 Unannotated [Lentimonas sp. CC10]CAA7072202.1 Unannotated [Lentimonas sp. CC11]
MRLITALIPLTLITVATSLQSQTELQWGKLGGDTEITQSIIKLERPFNTTFKAGTQTSPIQGNGYYPNADGYAPSFNLTASSPQANASIANKPDGDSITTGKNEPSYQSMVVWENAPEGRLENIAIDIKGSGSGFISGSYRLLIQQANNSWVASQPFEITKPASDASDRIVNNLKWYHFTPVTDKEATIGDPTPVNLDNIKSVGYYNRLQGNATKSYRGCEVSYFKATFAPMKQLQVKASSLKSQEKKPADGKTRIIADFEEDFKIDNSQSGWTYQWNPTGVEIGQSDRYQDLKPESKKSWRLVVDPAKKPGASSGPVNARWLMARKGQITSGDSSEVSTDGLTHFVIVSYTIQPGEAGIISIQDSQIYGKNENSSNALHIYVKDELLGTDVTTGKPSSFNINLGRMDEGDTFTLAVGGYNKKSGGVNIQFKLCSSQ